MFIHLKRFRARRSLPSLKTWIGVAWVGLLLCFAGSAFGMRRSVDVATRVKRTYSKVSFWREQQMAKAALSADLDAIKIAMHFLDNARENLGEAGRFMREIESYGQHNKKEFDALMQDMSFLHESTVILIDRLKNIKKEKD